MAEPGHLVQGLRRATASSQPPLAAHGPALLFAPLSTRHREVTGKKSSAFLGRASEASNFSE